MTRAVLYARVSQMRQATDDHFSLPVQHDLYVSRCAERGYQLGPEYIDQESGRTTTRRGYQRLLADARAGLFDVIVVRSIDRFGRDADEITVRTSELRQAGVKVDAIKSVAGDDMPPSTQFLLRAIEAFLAEQESAQIAVRVRGGMRKSVESGIWQGRVAYGYRTVDKRLVVHEAEASVVRRVFTMYADDNLGPRSIARALNAAGIPSATKGLWSNIAVNKMLQRVTYTGTVRWGEVDLPGAAPAIIDPALWDRTRARHRTRSRMPGGQTHVSEHLLTGLVWCGCGKRMGAHRSSPKAGGGRGYVCRGWANGDGDHSNYHNAADLEARVVAKVSRLMRVRPGKRPSPIAGIEAELREAQADLASLPAKRKRVNDAYTKGLYASDAQFAAANRDLLDDEERMTARIEGLMHQLHDARTAESDLAARPERVRLLLDPAAPLAERKGVLHTYLKSVVVPLDDPEPQIFA